MSRRRSTEAVCGSGAAAGGRQFFRLPPRCGLSNLADLVSCGAIAQLGERYNGIVEVTGSIPVGSTNSREGLSDRSLSPSLSQDLEGIWGSIRGVGRDRDCDSN